MFAFPWLHQIVVLLPSFSCQSLFPLIRHSYCLILCFLAFSLFLLKIRTVSINAAPKVNLKQTSHAQSKCISIFSSKHLVVLPQSLFEELHLQRGLHRATEPESIEGVLSTTQRCQSILLSSPVLSSKHFSLEPMEICTQAPLLGNCAGLLSFHKESFPIDFSLFPAFLT